MYVSGCCTRYSYKHTSNMHPSTTTAVVRVPGTYLSTVSVRQGQSIYVRSRVPVLWYRRGRVFSQNTPHDKPDCILVTTSTLLAPNIIHADASTSPSHLCTVFVQRRHVEARSSFPRPTPSTAAADIARKTCSCASRSP